MKAKNKPEPLKVGKNLFVIDLDVPCLVKAVFGYEAGDTEKVAVEEASKAAKETGHCVVVAKPVAWF